MYSVEQYLKMLRLAKRAPGTIVNYEKVFRTYAAFLDVPLSEVHNHLTPENLIRFSEARQDMSPTTLKGYLSILYRYFALNGVKFDPLEINIVKACRMEEPDDKPLELETLKKMMDLASIHAKAIISTFISTGMRRKECSQILLSDLNGDTIRIRNEIAKRGKGGTVYLTSEAREYIDLWLRERDQYIKIAEMKRFREFRPKDDQRLFACCDATMRGIFMRLYDKVDGERGKYHSKITLHSCRRYFRTHAVKTMPLDLVEKILRHSGYLTSSYVRITDDEARRVFHAGESALYITRGDQRLVAESKEAINRVAELERRMKLLELMQGK